jgi:hypothetical protein
MAQTNTNVCSCTRGKQIENLVKETLPEKQIKETLLRKLHDEGTVFDVRFKFKWDNMWWDTGRLTANKTPSEFVYVYAHRCVLETHAPELARICLLLSASDDNDENILTVNITDVKPVIFRYMIYFVYGVSVPRMELRKHAKDFIEVANKYSIVTLKAQAEASYMESTEITKDNAIDNLLYADKMSCALLKEAAIKVLEKKEANENLVEKKTNEGGKAAKRKSEEQDSNAKEAEAEAETKTKKPKNNKTDSKKNKDHASVAGKSIASLTIAEVTTAIDTDSNSKRGRRRV